MIRSLARQLAGLAVTASRSSSSSSRAFSSAVLKRQAPLAVARAPKAASPSPLCGSSIAMRAALLMPTAAMQVRSMGYNLKSKSSVKKRFRVNANGTVKRAQANKRHLATKKNRKRIRRLGQTVLVEGKIRKNIISLLPGRV
ncbi:hypothetical protein P43SY_005974 [Pythium insidiosum]|uniref:50S ribosomal protein L35 n=1 Tax=Pythium insidiosum TaxID=114742 RepID=A0AAD5LUF3_PYTIN|nr:hypothetical protein P43SY_005974 [Pythium insidiosum]